MAHIKLKLFANIRELVGQSKLEYEAKNLIELLHKFIDEYPDANSIVFEDSGNDLQGYINIFINGTNIMHLDGINSSLSDGDEVAILPPVSGG
ncbi:ubiquitin-like small modifier protein 1 [Methanosalsum natronophilum]|nr:ubiquitin-like small modifier protein 1 [Methanosalsum natronophilum]MCS3923528.1 molybdopterin synthase sulfur carrier subunit [Methanosalsum natronophilum]